MKPSVSSALAVGRSALSAAWILLAGCHEVEQCQRGESGCLAGPPKDGACRLGLVLINGACAEPGASAPALNCRCKDGEVCTLDDYRCVNYCEPLDVDIGSVPPRAALSCSANGLDFDQLCVNRCLVRCRQWQDLCANSAGCGEESCRSAAEKASCREDCGSAADPVRCLAQTCSDLSGRACTNVDCPDQKSPRCDGVLCRNSCSGFNFDGVCDDGDLKTAQFGACAYGTDCADCGPRRGQAPRPAAQGEPCAFHTGCAGAKPNDIGDAQAWCIEIAPGLSRCAPDCSTPDKICPEGSSCFTLSGVDQNGDGTADPRRQGARTASACFPNAMCR